MTFGDKVKQLRLNAGMTQYELADKLNLSRSAIAGYESEEKQASVKIIKELSNIFNVSIDYLLGETDIKNKPDDILKGEYHKDFENVDEALKFILEDNTVMAFGEFDIDKLTDDEVLQFTNDLKNQIGLLSYKYKR